MMDPLAEFEAARTRITGRHILEACRLKLPNPVVWPGAAAPLWAVASIAPGDDGLYRPDESPFPADGAAFLVPVGELSPDGTGWLDMVDLCAFLPGSPGRWWLRHRRWPILGRDHVERAAHFGTPVDLVRNPLEWLRRGGDAACVIDWSLNPLLHMAGVEVTVDDDQQLRRLSNSVARSMGPTRITVRRAARAEAA